MKGREVSVIEMLQMLFPNVIFEFVEDLENINGYTRISKTSCLIRRKDVQLISGKVLGVSADEIVEVIQRLYGEVKSWYLTLPTTRSEIDLEVIE